jgi:hypothetical protein
MHHSSCSTRMAQRTNMEESEVGRRDWAWVSASLPSRKSSIWLSKRARLNPPLRRLGHAEDDEDVIHFAIFGDANVCSSPTPAPCKHRKRKAGMGDRAGGPRPWCFSETRRRCSGGAANEGAGGFRRCWAALDAGASALVAARLLRHADYVRLRDHDPRDKVREAFSYSQRCVPNF